MSTTTNAKTEASLSFVDPRHFKANTRSAVDDASLRRSFRSAMDFLQGKRAAHFGDQAEFERLRHVGEAFHEAALRALGHPLHI